MKELTNTNLLQEIKKEIESIGISSKTLCINIFNFLNNENTKENRKLLTEETNLSKQSITQMFKAGKLYSENPVLIGMSHTNIVELAPIEKYETIENATIKILGNNDLSQWELYTQKEIRTLVNNYITSLENTEDTEVLEETEVTEDVENTEDIKEEIKLFFDYLVTNYEIDKEDSNTLKYYFSLI